ncbi:hypothetical protein [Streptomyces sp. NBC_01601]|uniref:hypothetical protein n=1 Tax=Streptomyces sp. NBC_01601 TaxID=2975892 RepID=UPI002E2AFC37|nr:hypothetical protein [Streptomyces sp. NBC_01601]
MSTSQPRRTPAFAALVALTPGADVITVRADPRDWNRAELLAAHTWPRNEGEPLQPLDGPYPDDSLHTSLTIGEFLARARYVPAVRAVRITETTHTYRVELNRPGWER